MSVWKNYRDSRYQPITLHNIAKHTLWQRLDPELREAVEVTARVLPFRSNRYVVEELIDWERVPDDPLLHVLLPLCHRRAFHRRRSHGDESAGTAALH